MKNMLCSIFCLFACASLANTESHKLNQTQNLGSQEIEDKAIQTLLPERKKDRRLVAAQQYLEKDQKYYTFGPPQYLYARKRVVSDIVNVADLLATKKIIMGVGFLSRKDGGPIAGLKTHRKGIDFNLQYLFDDGSGGGVSDFKSYKQKGYSQEKTLEMLKAFIDKGRGQIARILTNDLELNSKLKAYARKHGIDLFVSEYSGFDNKILVGYRD